MAEIKSKRRRRVQFFDDGRARFHASDRFYFNKLGVGDSIGDWRSIDMTLEKVPGGWRFLYHSFHPFIPDYADEWARFRDVSRDRDQVIRTRAVCNHVQGVLMIDPASGVNWIVYMNAFSPGIDLIYGFARTGLRKLIRFRNYPAVDSTYDFMLDLPAGKDLTRDGQIVDLNTDSDFTEPAQMEIGGSVIRAFYMWDHELQNNPRKKPIRVQLLTGGPHLRLRKHIRANFFNQATGEVFTDTQFDVDANGGDGNLVKANANYNTAHDAVSSDSSDDAGNFAYPLTNWAAGPVYTIYRTAYPIDTQTLPAGATISAATFYVYAHGAATDTDTTYMQVVETFTAGTASLVVGDYEDIGSDNGTAGRAKEPSIEVGCDTNVTLASISGAGWESWPLNATGLGWIVKAGYTKLGLRIGLDLSETAPTGVNRVFIHSSENASGNSPYLDVTYTLPTTIHRRRREGY
jgi:hypothetical protein